MSKKLPPLPDEAIVVRGGASPAEHMAKRARRYKGNDPNRPFAISCASYPGMSADEAAEERGLPNALIREATAGAIRAAGYHAYRDNPNDPGHVAITPPDPSVNDWRVLDQVLSPPRRKVRTDV